MISTEQKKKLITAANAYSDIATNDSMVKAGQKYWNDYDNGKYTFDEHLILPRLIQAYINCKNGGITREQCLYVQKTLFEGFLKT